MLYGHEVDVSWGYSFCGMELIVNEDTGDLLAANRV